MPPRPRWFWGLGACAAVAAGLSLFPPVVSAQAPSLTHRLRYANSISGNWAGYVAASGSGVTSVTGTWRVPDAGSLPPGLSSTWVGIGGFTTGDLIQAGTQQASPPFDSVIAGGAYAAWYELLPAFPVFISGCSGDSDCTVVAGDSVTVTITKAGTLWQISMADSGRWTYSTSLAYASSQSSAEWIHESPSLAGFVPVPVGNSGAVTFDGNNSAVIASSTRTIGQTNATATDALPVETTTSALDSDGDGFSVCTYSLACSPPAS